jgi:hypothetical protein
VPAAENSRGAVKNNPYHHAPGCRKEIEKIWLR